MGVGHIVASISGLIVGCEVRPIVGWSRQGDSATGECVIDSLIQVRIVLKKQNAVNGRNAEAGRDGRMSQIENLVLSIESSSGNLIENESRRRRREFDRLLSGRIGIESDDARVRNGIVGGRKGFDLRIERNQHSFRPFRLMRSPRRSPRMEREPATSALQPMRGSSSQPSAVERRA